MVLMRVNTLYYLLYKYKALLLANNVYFRKKELENEFWEDNNMKKGQLSP